MAHQFSYDQIARLRDTAATLAVQSADHERALGAVLDAAALESDAAVDLRRAAREHSVATARLASEVGHRQDRGAGEHSRPHAVLVVDDYQDSRESLAMVLHNAGFIVRTAANGLEALIAAYEMHPAVIVMDMMMPVLNGVEATRLIKAIDELRDARVIAYSAMSSLDASATAPLFSQVVRKPSSPEVLVAAIHRFLPS
jgi:two-component system cell cycle response regulator DivK